MAAITTRASRLLASRVAGGRRWCQAQAVVLYDKGCPLCVWEVSHYKKMDASNKIDWIDVSSPAASGTLQRIGATREQALTALHVVSPSGQLSKGIDAFPAIWDQLPYFHRLAPVYRTGLAWVPGLRPGLEAVYRWFIGSSLRRRLPAMLGMSPEVCVGVPGCR